VKCGLDSTGPVADSCKHGKEQLHSIRRGISGEAERLSASQQGLCSIQLLRSYGFLSTCVHLRAIQNLGIALSVFLNRQLGNI
jgi:hypothetical protein